MLCRILNSAHGSPYSFPKSEKKKFGLLFILLIPMTVRRMGLHSFPNVPAYSI